MRLSPISKIRDQFVSTALHAGVGVVLAVALAMAGPAGAQGVEFGFAASAGGPRFDEAKSVAVDASGNVYSVGRFQETADFDPGLGELNLTALGAEDLFVQKLDSNGDLVWAVTIGGSTGGEDDGATGVTVDTMGNVYIIGSFSLIVDFDPGAGVFNLSNFSGTENVYILKLDPDGNFVWAKAMNGTFSLGTGIVVDGMGDVYTTGWFSGTADFDPGTGVFNITSAGDIDIFVSKLDSNGDFVWAKAMGGPDSARSNSIGVDGSGNVYTTGVFAATADFDPGTGVFNLTSASGSDIFVSKLDSSGDFLWAVTMTGPFAGDEIEGNDLAVDGPGNVYITGSFFGTPDFDPGPGTANMTSLGFLDIFVEKLDPSGNFLWVRAMGGPGQNTGLSITLDGSGNVYTSGTFSQTVDFDPGVNNFDVVSAFGIEAFVHAMDTAGNFLWVKTMGGVNGGRTFARGVAADDIGNVYAAGTFEGTVDFDPDAGIANLTSDGTSGDIFVLKLIPDATAPTADTITPSTVGPTNAASIDFTVTFSEAVVNFGDAADVVVSHTGTAHTGVSITGGPVTYTVSVTGITGNGSFTLAVDTTSDVQDTSANALTTSVTSAAVTIDDTAPTLSIGAPSSSLTMVGPVSYLVTYVGADTVNLTNGDVTLNATGTTGTVTVTNGTTSTPTVTIDAIGGDGTLGISINAGTASNMAGGMTAAAGPSDTFIVDNTPPTVSISGPTPGQTENGPITFEVTYSGADMVNLTSADLTLNTTGTATGTISVTNGTTNTPTVTVDTISGDGTLGISINAGTATDDAGNSALSAGPSPAANVNSPVPTLSIGAPSTSLTMAGPVSYVVTYTNADAVNLTSGDVTLNTTGTATGTVTVTNGTTSTPTVTINPISGDGTVGISIGAGTASNSGGTAPAAGPSATATVDNTAPSVSIGAPTERSLGQFSYPVTYVGADTVNLTISDITLNAPAGTTATRSLLNGTTSTPTVFLSEIVGDGAVSFTIAPGTASDAVGNAEPVGATSSTVLARPTYCEVAALPNAALNQFRNDFGLSLTMDIDLAFFGGQTINSITDEAALALGFNGSCPGLPADADRTGALMLAFTLNQEALFDSATANPGNATELKRNIDVLAALASMSTPRREGAIFILNEAGFDTTGLLLFNVSCNGSCFPADTKDAGQKGVTEPFSAMGDFDGDGIANYIEWENVLLVGGTVQDFGNAAVDPGDDGTGTISGPLDSDGDGVPDSEDMCQNTAPGTDVDENGCPIGALANDFFEDAVDLGSDLSQLIQGTDNFNATSEVDEPDHRGNSAGASVWFSWTAPALDLDSPVAIFTLLGSDFDALVSIYTGDTVDALTSVEDLNCVANDYGNFAFEPITGTTYRIAIDGVASLPGVTKGLVMEGNIQFSLDVIELRNAVILEACMAKPPGTPPFCYAGPGTAAYTSLSTIAADIMLMLAMGVVLVVAGRREKTQRG